MNVWRAMIDGPADGAWNMAVDRAVLHAHEAGEAPPTLRLYSWERPTVSLGRFQRVTDVDQEAAAEHNIALCRRPTGGRGVLHADEVTYSIVCGVRDGLPRGVHASYSVICGALVEAYRRLGVDAAMTTRSQGTPGAGACYLHSTRADLSLGAAKLSGSAQVWLRDSCLQHGSFVFSRDIALESLLFKLGTAGADELTRAAVTLTDALGERPNEDAVRAAVIESVASSFGVSLDADGLSPRERESARRHVSEFEL